MVGDAYADFGSGSIVTEVGENPEGATPHSRKNDVYGCDPLGDRELPPQK